MCFETLSAVSPEAEIDSVRTDRIVCATKPHSVVKEHSALVERADGIRRHYYDGKLREASLLAVRSAVVQPALFSESGHEKGREKKIPRLLRSACGRRLGSGSRIAGNRSVSLRSFATFSPTYPQ